MTNRVFRLVAGTAVGVAVIAGASACESDDQGHTLPQVVASTNVWGDIAKQVAGDDAEVTSIISDPSADPHSFESSPTDIAKITDAELVVYNGKDYDPFVDKALSGAPKDKKVIEAAVLAPADDQNEHYWYNTAAVSAVAQQIATDLGHIAPAHAGKFTGRATAFQAKLKAIDAITAGIAAKDPHATVAQTEPVAHYLVKAAKLTDATPAEFEHAIEDGNDPSPAVVAATLDLLTNKQVRALVYNTQTEDKVTEQLLNAAKTSAIAVVDVTETLPAGKDYITWQTDMATALAAAVQ